MPLILGPFYLISQSRGFRELPEKVATGLHYQDKQLKAVREAIYNFMPGFSDLKMSAKRQNEDGY